MSYDEQDVREAIAKLVSEGTRRNPGELLRDAGMPAAPVLDLARSLADARSDGGPYGLAVAALACGITLAIEAQP